MKIVIKSRIKLDLCRHGHYMRNDIINASKCSSLGWGRLQGRLRRLFLLSDRMICCLLSVLSSLKLICFLLPLGKQNCTDLWGPGDGAFLEEWKQQRSGSGVGAGAQRQRSSSSHIQHPSPPWGPSGSAAMALGGWGMPTGHHHLPTGQHCPGSRAAASPPGSRGRVGRANLR